MKVHNFPNGIVDLFNSDCKVKKQSNTLKAEKKMKKENICNLEINIWDQIDSQLFVNYFNLN